MEINELKKMLKKSTAVLILENGDPSLVVLDYKTYRELLNEHEGDLPLPPSPATANRFAAPTPGEIELLERINKDILALKEQIAEEEKALDQ